MSEFPPEWEVYGAAEYELFGQAPLADAGIVATLCIQVSPAGRVIDHFKITLSGSVLLDVNLPLATLLPLPAPHDEYLFHFQVGLQAASPREDLTTSDWLDFETLLSRRTMLITDQAGENVDAAVVLALLNSTGTRRQAVGASIRWAVVGTPSGHLRLRLQSLPLPISFLPPALFVDNTVSVLVQEFLLHGEYFDGAFLNGPVPAFFSDEPVAARAALSADPHAAHAVIARLHKRFLLMEQLNLVTAAWYLTGKFRAARGVPVFKSSPFSAGPSAPKRLRPDAAPVPLEDIAADTGL